MNPDRNPDSYNQKRSFLAEQELADAKQFFPNNPFIQPNHSFEAKPEEAQRLEAERIETEKRIYSKCEKMKGYIISYEIIQKNV